MELTDYIRTLRKNWVLIVVLTLFGVGVSAAFSLLQNPTFQASTQVFVSTQSGSDSVGELAQGNSYTLQRVNTYARLASTQKVLEPVIDELGLATTAGQLASQVSATAQTDTTILNVTVQSGSAEEAALLADAVAASLTTQVQSLETADAAQAVSPVRLEIVEPATVPATPISPRVAVNVAIGLLLGLVVGIAIAFLREVLDNKVRGAQHIQQVTDLPVVGGISFDAKAKSRPLIVHADPLNPRAEAYRALRTNLQFVEVDGGSRSFVVTSSMPGEGKSTSTANLALALADAGQTVILIDADLRKPKVAEYLNLEGRVGLTDVLIGRVELADAVQHWGDGGLYVLAAGQVPPNPSELLGSKAMQALIGQLEAEFDWVIFDAPPVLPVTDAAILSKHLTGALVVVAAGKTSKHQLESALNVLDNVGAPVAGLVLTLLPTKGADAYGAYGYGAYGYSSYGYTQAAKKKRGLGLLGR